MSGDDKGADNPGPFVVSYACAVCRGQGCSTCRGTGVARFFHGTKAELNTGDLIKPRALLAVAPSPLPKATARPFQSSSG